MDKKLEELMPKEALVHLPKDAVFVREEDTEDMDNITRECVVVKFRDSGIITPFVRYSYFDIINGDYIGEAPDDPTRENEYQQRLWEEREQMELNASRPPYDDCRNDDCSDCEHRCGPNHKERTMDELSKNDKVVTITASVDFLRPLIQELINKKPIAAIKWVREQTGLGLKEAKEQVDKMFALFELYDRPDSWVVRNQEQIRLERDEYCRRVSELERELSELRQQRDDLQQAHTELGNSFGRETSRNLDQIEALEKTLTFYITRPELDD